MRAIYLYSVSFSPRNWASFSKILAIENVEIKDSGNYCTDL